MSGQSIKPVAPSNNSLNPRIDYFKNFKFWVEYNEICLKTDRVAFNSKKQTRGPYYLVNSFTLRNSFFFLLSFFFGGVGAGVGVLTWLKRLINILILDMVFHLMYVEFFH